MLHIAHITLTRISAIVSSCVSANPEHPTTQSMRNAVHLGKNILQAIIGSTVNPDTAATELVFHAVHLGINQQHMKTSPIIKVRDVGNRTKV